MDHSQADQPVETISNPVEVEDIFSMCAQCGDLVRPIKGDSHNYCQNCGFRDSCC